MSRGNSNRSALGSARVDWSRVTRAVRFAESELGGRFNGDGLVRGATHRGWLRGRLRELLESFRSAEDAQTWVRAACFKARCRGAQPMAYFAKLVKGARDDARMRELLGLLTVDEYREFQLLAGRQNDLGVARKGEA